MNSCMWGECCLAATRLPRSASASRLNGPVSEVYDVYATCVLATERLRHRRPGADVPAPSGTSASRLDCSRLEGTPDALPAGCPRDGPLHAERRPQPDGPVRSQAGPQKRGGEPIP